MIADSSSRDVQSDTVSSDVSTLLLRCFYRSSYLLISTISPKNIFPLRLLSTGVARSLSLLPINTSEVMCLKKENYVTIITNNSSIIDLVVLVI